MAWYNMTGESSDTVISTRVRFARNLAGYNFDSTLGEKEAREIIEKISDIFTPAMGFERIDLNEKNRLEALSYVEKHFISREFAAKKTPHTLLLSEKFNTAVMVCEEDHVRLQTILPGLSLNEAYEDLCRFDDQLDSNVQIAYDEKLGYLTHCPTNLGTGMRASVMMFLPALTMAKQIGGIASQLSKIGLTIRGMYGEGSESRGSLYQISNQVTLGVSEEETIRKLSEIVAQISNRERKLRATLKDDRFDALKDKVLRAEGTLRYAHMLSSAETTELFSLVRLGVAMGIIEDVDCAMLSRILVETAPATLTLTSEKELKTDTERDIARAEKIKAVLPM
ncbi:MAG: protein arginine kinase [Clostridia bacterium]|nr:protein arginine kinase [Clostridia bacterium]